MVNNEKRSDQEVYNFLKSMLEVGEKYIQELKDDLKENKKVLKVSDVLDEDGHQYVNLVQQGGGMLGVALLGYTYVLERMDIRFLKLAGTSAGAINATLMATLKPDSARTLKSPIILYYLAQKKLFDFVDGNSIIKRLTKNIIRRKKLVTNILLLIAVPLLVSPVLLLAGSFGWNLGLHLGKWLFIALLVLLIAICVFLWLFKRSQFGINPGRTFHGWITDLIKNGEVHSPEDLGKPLQIILDSGKTVDIYNPKNGVVSLHDLELKLNKIPTLKYNYGNSQLHLDDNFPLVDLQEYDKDEPTLAIITTELATENKIVFPKMWRLFYQDHDHVLPADFVRASMSIPFFFEAFRIKNVPKREDRSEEWLKYLRYDGNTIDEAVFIDGGVLSNFPINVFNPTRVRTPRLPTFGVRLQTQDPASSRSVKKFFGIIGSMISTARAHYDKDFLITHPQYERCLADIDVKDFNWLDFSLPLEQQIALFEKGAQAAKEFLLKFDWEQYKQDQKALNEGVLSADVRSAVSQDAINKLIKTEFEKREVRKKPNPEP